MANLIQTLISKVNSLTVLVNSITTNAKKIEELPEASLPLASNSFFHVSQNGSSKKVSATDVVSTATGTAEYPYQSPTIWKASGNVGAGLEAGDMVERWWSPTEFWKLARYDSGLTTVKDSYTIIDSIEDL